MITSTEQIFTPQPQPVATATGKNVITIGLPRTDSRSERRFPLTPEGVQMLTEAGYTVKMEHNAAATIHYHDPQYTRYGASIASRDEVLRCDIVISLAHPALSDICKMRRGAMLLTLYNNSSSMSSGLVKELMRMGITTIALDLIENTRDIKPFADILNEIDGRASMAIASSLLADAVHGKGILLGGVAGITPCETLIIGSNDTACAAARSAMGMGSIVNMMDNDVFRLRHAVRQFDQRIVTSTLTPRGLDKALRSADVVIYTDIDRHVTFDASEVAVMKRGVITFDLSKRAGGAFPSLPAVNLADSSAADNSVTRVTRVCYINAGSAVPRTAAMAMSNIFVNLFSDISDCGTTSSALKLLPELQVATLTYAGKVVNAPLAEAVGVRYSNISIYLALS